MPGFMSSGPPEALAEVVRYARTMEGFIRAEDVVPGVKALWFESEEEARTAQWLMEMAGSQPGDWSELYGEEGEE